MTLHACTAINITDRRVRHQHQRWCCCFFIPSSISFGSSFEACEQKTRLDDSHACFVISWPVRDSRANRKWGQVLCGAHSCSRVRGVGSFVSLWNCLVAWRLGLGTGTAPLNGWVGGGHLCALARTATADAAAGRRTGHAKTTRSSEAVRAPTSTIHIHTHARATRRAINS